VECLDDDEEEEVGEVEYQDEQKWNKCNLSEIRWNEGGESVSDRCMVCYAGGIKSNEV